MSLQMSHKSEAYQTSLKDTLTYFQFFTDPDLVNWYTFHGKDGLSNQLDFQPLYCAVCVFTFLFVY